MKQYEAYINYTIPEEKGTFYLEEIPTLLIRLMSTFQMMPMYGKLVRDQKYLIAVELDVPLKSNQSIRFG